MKEWENIIRFRSSKKKIKNENLMAESYMLVENYDRRSVNIHDICYKGRFE